jgi:hypothetical protein
VRCAPLESLKHFAAEVDVECGMTKADFLINWDILTVAQD